MKIQEQKNLLSWLAAAAAAACLWLALPGRTAFVYETPNEFLSSGDFNGDGISDVLVLDKLTGNARVGYSDGNGHLIWSTPLVTGAQNVTGCGVENFFGTNRDSIAVTAPALNAVNLVDVSQTNAVGFAQTFTPAGIGPHAVAGLHAPRGSIKPGLPFLFVASSLNAPDPEWVELGQWTNINYPNFGETGPFDLPNALDTTNNPTLAVGMVRGVTNDALHLLEFDNVPGIVGIYNNLPSGSSYTFGTFNGELFPRFIFYQPGGSNLTIVPLLITNSTYAFGTALSVTLTDAVQNVFTLSTSTNNSAIVQFGDGVQGLTLPGGSPVLSAMYSPGTGAAGNVFTGVVPLANGQFALLDAPTGTASAHEQIMRFDGTNFTRFSATNLPALSSKTTRANVWLFQSEPFVNRSPGFIASLNSPDWADGVSGLPGVILVPTEADAGSTNGLGNVSTNNLGTPPAGAAFGIANQYGPAISLFSFSAPQAAPPVIVTISPAPGPYGSPQTISFVATPAGAQVQYRANSLDAWHNYTTAFSISNDCTVQYYGMSTLGVRGSLQSASYTFGNPANTGTNSPILTDPGNTNTVAVFSTNQLTLSQNGTVFYGRRSAANVGTIWAINLDGSSDTYITTGVRPRVTPDGRWLAFMREGNPFSNQGNIWIRDLQSGAESRLFTNPNYITGYDWETNETALIMDYSCGIWNLNTNGSLNALFSVDCFDDAPVRNPADGRIAFQNLNPNTAIAGLYVAGGDGAGRQRIVSTIPGASWPAWSPDGGDLVFADGNNTNANSGKNLWLVYPDGTGLLQISGFTDATNGFPHGAIWSPDDSTLVAAGTIFGTNGLWLIPLTPDHTECAGAPILLPTSPGDAIDFAGSVVTTATATSVTYANLGLFIQLDPTLLVVYWSTNYEGFTLESATALPAGLSWSSVTGPYYRAGPYFEYQESRNALSPQKYFRLRYPGVIVLTPP